MGTNQNNNNRRIPFLFIMLAILMVVALVTGAATGILAREVIKRLGPMVKKRIR